MPPGRFDSVLCLKDVDSVLATNLCLSMTVAYTVLKAVSDCGNLIDDPGCLMKVFLAIKAIFSLD
jgi:hypothetical protein